MSVKMLSASSVLKELPEIDPRNWAEFSLDAYVSKVSCILEEKDKALGIKENAVRMLKKRLFSSVKPPIGVVAIGLLGEPYPEAERHYRLTRGLIQTLYDKGFPLHLQSSSLVIVEDFPLLKEYSMKLPLHICIPMPLLHPFNKRLYEMDFLEGLELVKIIKEALPEAKVSVNIINIYPGLCDEEYIRKSFTALKKTGINAITVDIMEALSLKKTQEYCDIFMDEKVFIEKLCHDYNLEMEEDGLVLHALSLDAKQKLACLQMIEDIRLEYALENAIARHLPLDYRYSNYEISEQLFLRAKRNFYDEGEQNEIIEVAQSIQKLDYAINKEELLHFTRCVKAKRDIDYFLQTHELKQYGQRAFFRL